LGHKRWLVPLRGTLDNMLLATWHPDTLDLKIQFTSEIRRFYWDAYQNQTDKIRVQNDMDEIIDINGRSLESRFLSASR
jgi:hypothetical protein